MQHLYDMMRERSRPPVRPHAFLNGGWMDFVYIGYRDQVPSADDFCKREFGSVSNVSNYGNYFNKFRVFVLISQRRAG